MRGRSSRGRKRDLCSLAFPLSRVVIRAERDEVARLKKKKEKIPARDRVSTRAEV